LERRVVREARSAGGTVRRPARDGPLDRQGEEVERAKEVSELDGAAEAGDVLAGLRGDRSVRDVCREHGISETLYYGWRDKILEAGREALAGKEERSGERELRRRVRELERALGRKTYELEIAGEAADGRAGRRERCKWDSSAVAVRSSAVLRLV
jgi:transposase